MATDTETKILYASELAAQLMQLVIQHGDRPVIIDPGYETFLHIGEIKPEELEDMEASELNGLKVFVITQGDDAP